VCAIEALLHWKEPQLGEVASDDFVPLLEETGLILTVGRWALHAACRYASHLQSSGHEGMRVAVKLSVPQFRDPGLARFIQQCLRETGLQGHHLEVAISAELLSDGSVNTMPMLDELHAMGLRVCVQGFGNGQVPLTSLTRAPLDTLTIDDTFVDDISHSADHRAVVSAITAVARSLGYSVLAEGVESEEQLTLLREQGCDELQGSYFSQPLDAAGLEAWLSHHRTGTRRGAGATVAPFDS
jgi:EAL domain-containing protein (putative c-di-GMP-specific phosphodiesterase class I)